MASIKEQVRNELVGEFNAWAKQTNLPTLSFLASTPVDSYSQPKGQGEGDRHGGDEIRGEDVPPEVKSIGLLKVLKYRIIEI